MVLCRVWPYPAPRQFGHADSILRRLVQARTGWGVELQSDEFGAYIYNEFRTQDSLHVDAVSIYERVPVDFELPGGIIVPQGAYRFNTASMNFTTSPARNINGNLRVVCCEFYDGDQLKLEGRLTLTPSNRFAGSVLASHQDISLPGGDLAVKILTVEGRYNVSPDMSFAAQIQHDSISEELGARLSYRWEPSPGREVLITLGHRAESDDHLVPRHWEGRDTSVTIRFGQSIQF